jgi:hypothetical protein
MRQEFLMPLSIEGAVCYVNIVSMKKFTAIKTDELVKSQEFPPLNPLPHGEGKELLFTRPSRLFREAI